MIGAGLALAACGGGASGEGDLVEAVDVSPGPAEIVMLPGDLPDGFAVTSARPGDGQAALSRALVIGPESGIAADPFADDPIVVIGASVGSASIAGPRRADGESVDGLDGGIGPAALVEDGRWTWVLFGDEDVCFDDCVRFVAGRNVGGDDLVELARATTRESDDDGTRPTVDPAAVPDGLAVLGTVGPSDGLTSIGVSSIHIDATGGPGGGWMTVQSTPADPLLAAVWAFWVDDAGTQIRGHPGRAGPARASIDEADVARVWVEDGTLVAVLGWSVDEADVDAVVAGLRPGTSDDLAALEVSMTEPPTTLVVDEPTG